MRCAMVVVSVSRLRHGGILATLVASRRIAATVSLMGEETVGSGCGVDAGAVVASDGSGCGDMSGGGAGFSEASRAYMVAGVGEGSWP